MITARMESGVSYVYGLKSAAQMLNISRSTLIRRIKSHGAPPLIKLGNRESFMFALPDLQSWHARVTGTPTDEEAADEANA